MLIILVLISNIFYVYNVKRVIFKLMKKILLTTLTALSVAVAFGQNNSYINSGSIGKAPQEKPAQKEEKFLYGPVKFRELSETVGEKYIIVPLSKRAIADGYSFISTGETFDRVKKLSAAEGAGKILIMQSVKNGYAHFKDSLGNSYVSEIVDGYMYNLVSAYDIDEARKLFLGKVLWLNQDMIFTYDEVADKYSQIKSQRFEPVEVVNIVLSNSSSWPVRFMIKNKAKQIAFIDAIVSGTNMSIKYLKDYMLKTYSLQKILNLLTNSPPLCGLK